MESLPVLAPQKAANRHSGITFPTLITAAGEKASKRFLEFFTANIRNRNIRKAQAQAVARFANWCDIGEDSLSRNLSQ